MRWFFTASLLALLVGCASLPGTSVEVSGPDDQIDWAEIFNGQVSDKNMEARNKAFADLAEAVAAEASKQKQAEARPITAARSADPEVARYARVDELEAQVAALRERLSLADLLVRSYEQRLSETNDALVQARVDREIAVALLNQAHENGLLLGQGAEALKAAAKPAPPPPIDGEFMSEQAF